MLAFALYLVLNEKKLLKTQLDEITGMLFGELSTSRCVLCGVGVPVYT